MTREDIEASPKISPLAKLVLEWLSRRKAGIYTSAIIGKALGVQGSDVAAAGSELRGLNLIERKDGERTLPLAELLITRPAHAAYAPPVIPSASQKKRAAVQDPDAPQEGSTPHERHRED